MSVETLEFKAELKQLLHLITHSLYSDREIFLRELISNASDAINKVKFDSLNNEDKLEGNKDWKITITPNKDAKTLTIADNGVGMSRDEVIDCLGTIAKSGTKQFLERLKSQESKDLPGLIGQFGVGFYSSFMVADKVTVHTRPAGGPSLGVKWESDGQGQYALEEAEKADRGTTVTLHLKEDAAEYLDGWKLRASIKKFSDFIEHPVVLVTTEEKDGKTETVSDEVNSRKAVWLRSPRDVTEEEYNEFYKTLSHDSENPGKVLHFNIEGQSEFRALLFIPAEKPARFDWEEPKAGLKLYVQRVLIMDRCEEVLPLYLRFVSGVIDAADLPLNVSRELLQQNPQLSTIRKTVVRKILSTLETMKTNEAEKYQKFHRELGAILKEGLARDWENREKIADLLLFETAQSAPGTMVTLADYVAKMPEGQEVIYTLSGERAEQLRKSPYLESFRAKGYDVLLLTDPVDEYALPHLNEYKGKKLQSVDRGEVQADTSEIPEETKTKFAKLLTAIKDKLPEVNEVKLTNRLTESASCLVAVGRGMSAHLERLLKRSGHDVEQIKRTLELNPNNPMVQKLREMFESQPENPRLTDYARLLYDQAVIAEGSKIDDPVAFAKRINDLVLAANG
ncbi:MAG: molecular chaperone HtpG [Gemmataceae bacterium]